MIETTEKKEEIPLPPHIEIGMAKIDELAPGFVGETMMGGLIGDVEPSKNYWKYIH